MVTFCLASFEALKRAPGASPKRHGLLVIDEPRSVSDAGQPGEDGAWSGWSFVQNEMKHVGNALYRGNGRQEVIGGYDRRCLQHGFSAIANRQDAAKSHALRRSNVLEQFLAAGLHRRETGAIYGEGPRVLERRAGGETSGGRLG